MDKLPDTLSKMAVLPFIDDCAACGLKTEWDNGLRWCVAPDRNGRPEQRLRLLSWCARCGNGFLLDDETGLKFRCVRPTLIGPPSSETLWIASPVNLNVED